jgi:hypothetical protein
MDHRESERYIIPTTTAPSLSIPMVTILKPCATAQSNRLNARVQARRRVSADVAWNPSDTR